jgi:restriction endonuclease S subunit
VLLEKIAKEKARLIKEGKIKKPKRLREISDDEKPFELPEGWKWSSLGTISLINPRNEAADDSPASFVPMSLITTSHTGEHDQEERAWGTIKQGFTHFANGDIGLAKITPCFENSKAAVFSNLKNGIGAGTTELHIARPIENTLCARYVLLYLKSPQFLLLGEPKMTGTAGQKRLPKDFFAENPFPLPPLAEQHRIVAKVDELMTLCDQLEQQQSDSNAAHQILVETLLATLTSAADQDELAEAWQRIANHFDTLFTTEYSIDRLKETILQLAVMGKLVPQDPNDLPAPRPGIWFVYALECEDGSIYIGHSQDILKRWKQHAAGRGADWTKRHPPVKLVHWEDYDSLENAVQREEDLKTGFGRKWLKQEYLASRTRQAGEPASVLLEKIAKEKARLVKEGKIKRQSPLPKISEDEKPFELPAGWEFVRFGNATFNRDAERIPISVEERNGRRGKYNYYGASGIIDTIDDYLFEKPLLLIGEDGANLINRSTPIAFMARGKYWVNNHAHVIDGLTEELLLYICLHINAISLEPYVTGTAQPKMNQSKMNAIILALPPLAEQLRIVAKVDELMALCDTLKARLIDAQTTQVQLADAIVEQAVA